MPQAEVMAKLSSKSQVVIPKAVRERMGVGPGDVIAFEMRDGGEVVVRRALRGTSDDPFATFVEWSGAADEEAYRDL